MAHVPVARRNLFAEHRRAMLGIAGVAASLLLILTLGGIFAGAMRGVTRYIDTSGADIIVSQSGVRTMHMSSSSVPLSSVDEIRAVPGVSAADPLLYETSALLAGGRRELSYIIGFAADGLGGPVSITTGTQPGPGEIVVDDTAADRLGIGLGDEVRALDHRWTISGLTTDMSSIVNSVSYVRFDDLAAVRAVGGMASYVLVSVRGSVEPTLGALSSLDGLTAQTREGFSAQERDTIEDMSAQLMRLMTLTASLIGLAVIGLTLYASTLGRIHEVGVMKALGARTSRMFAIVLVQAAWTVGVAMTVAVLVTAGLGWLLELIENPFPIVLEAVAVGRIALVAGLLGAIGAVAPMIRVTRVDPASVFRR